MTEPTSEKPPQRKWTWEEAIKVFLDTTTVLTTRDMVAGPGSPDWSDFGSFRIEKDVPLSKDYTKIFDFWWEFHATLGSRQARYVVGFSANWKGYFDDPKSVYNLFLNEPYKGLSPLVNGTSSAKTAVVNSFTFENAKNELDGVVKWIEKWNPIIKSWGDDLDSEGSEWRGSAAGSFKKFIDTIHMEVNKVWLDVTTPSNCVELLETAKNSLVNASWGMYNGFEEWKTHRSFVPKSDGTDLFYRLYNGVELLRANFFARMKGAQLNSTWTTSSTFNPAGGGSSTTTVSSFNSIVDGAGNDVSSPEWVRGVEQIAKSEWLQSLGYLDYVATTHLNNLDNAYLPLAAALEQGVYQPNFTLPSGTGGAGGPGGPGGPGAGGGGSGLPDGLGGKGDGGGEGGAGGGGGGNIKIPDVTGGKEGGGGDGKNPGGLPTPPTIPPPVTVPDTTTGKPGSGPGTGNNVPLLDKNGKPVTGADGKPVMVPPGSRIGKDGKVYDSTGKPVMGSNGKQLVAPPGGKVGTPQPQPPTREENQTGGTPGLGYDRIRLPEGAKVLPDGSVVDAKGKPLLDANGNPYVLPKGATLKDGIVIDANGNPISRSHQMLTNAEHALSSRPEQKNPTTGGKNVFDGINTGGSGRKFDLNGLGSGGSGLGGGSGKSISSVVGGTGGTGERLARMLGEPSGTQATAGGTGTGAGTGTGGGTGTGTGGGTGAGGPQTAQSPMMPPMSPGAGGAGGQPNQGKDRQRTTWLTEDEDTWGTDTGSVSGVIGR
ncbi:hypothetical protein [Streptomyces termitum]|uniref:hypothetical protein n=1 Tax=Streptomyces termitum TaxID=67368 RepID=UPI0033A8F799